MPGSHFHRTIPDEELHRPAIISETDPGAVGADIAWYRPSTRVMSIRNAANDGWEALSAQPAEHGNEAHEPNFAEQSDLTTHVEDTTNPHEVTAAQAGADPAGSASAVQDNLTAHESDTDDPHETREFLLGPETLNGFTHRIAGYVSDALERELDEITTGYGPGRRVGVNADAYTVANDTADRSLDPTSYTDSEVEDLAHIVATLIRDLGRDE